MIYSVDIVDEEPHFVGYSAISHYHYYYHYYYYYYLFGTSEYLCRLSLAWKKSPMLFILPCGRTCGTSHLSKVLTQVEWLISYVRWFSACIAILRVNLFTCENIYQVQERFGHVQEEGKVLWWLVCPFAKCIKFNCGLSKKGWKSQWKRVRCTFLLDRSKRSGAPDDQWTTEYTHF